MKKHDHWWDLLGGQLGLLLGYEHTFRLTFHLELLNAPGHRFYAFEIGFWRWFVNITWAKLKL